MAKIKGSAVATILSYVEDKGLKSLWLESLSEKSKQIFLKPIYATNWYPVKEACIEPTNCIANLLKQDSNLVARDSGRYSAEKALTGIYKIFIGITSPTYLIKRSSVMLSSFYDRIDVEVLDSSSSHMNVKFYNFSFVSELVEYRIAGWMELALERAKCKNINFKFLKSVSRGDDFTELYITWI